MNNNEILYDHYKDTVSIAKNEENKRNKMFIIILCHLLILFLISMNPQSIYNTISELLKENLKTGFYFSINVFQISVMLSILYFTIRYYQVNIHIDKTYTYLHKIEEEIAENISENFGREGKNYLKTYPKTLDVIYYSYKYFFPFAYTSALICRLIINSTWNDWKIKLLEIIITLILIIINALYMYDTYSQEK